jgi:hypothetical protein
MHQLVLTCEAAELERRLRDRRLDRPSSPGFEEFVRDMVEKNEQLAKPTPGAEPQYVLLDTTRTSEKDVARQVISWIERAL